MILQYLNSTKEKSIQYKEDKNITVYSNVNFAEDKEKRKSITGYIFLNGIVQFLGNYNFKNV